MAWITPKTDWVESDTIEYTDTQRIRGNYLYIADLAQHLYDVPLLVNMVEKTAYTDIFYHTDMNAFEDNLDIINNATFLFDIGTKTTYAENSLYPTPAEMNRIESAMLRIKNYLESQKTARAVLQFRLGNFHGLRV